MKRIVTAAAVLALGASLAFAGPGEGRKHGKHEMHGKGGAAHMERMAEKLNLSEGQKIQMEELRKGFQVQNEPLWTAMKQTKSEMKAAREAGDTARVEALRATVEQQRTQMKDQRQAPHEQMMNILTPEQRTQLEAMKSERGHRGHRSKAPRT
jgi:Spy/CpxP family protein refolding chaperone